MRKKNKMKKEMVKRISAFMLAATMCVSACPTAVMAEESPSVDNNIIKNDENGIPDKTLYQYLLKTGDKNGDKQLSLDEAENINDLLIHLEKGEKIETFKNLGEYVDASVFYFLDEHNEESMTTFTNEDIDEFAKMETLYDFIIYDAKVEGTESLAKLTNLRELSLARTSLTNVDFLKQENLPKLTILNLSNCGLMGIFDVSDLSNLTELDLMNNELTEIKGLDKLTKLTRLVIQGNQLTESPTLEYMTELKTLYIEDNELTEIKGLDKLTKLEYISANGNKLKTLPDLSALTNLEDLYVSGNELETLPNMQGLTSLKHFLADENYLKTLPDMKGLTNLEYFNLNENLLTKEELVAKLPKQYATNTQWIEETVNQQKKGIEVEFTTDVTEIKYGEKVTVNLTFKNKGTAIENLYVTLTENGKSYFPTSHNYTTTENGVCIDSLAYEEDVTFTYEVTMNSLRDRMYFVGTIKTEDDSIYYADSKEVLVELPQEPEEPEKPEKPKETVECTLSSKVTEVEQDEDIPVTLSIKNTGDALKNLYVELYVNGCVVPNADGLQTVKYKTTENGICLEGLAQGEELVLEYIVNTDNVYGNLWIYGYVHSENGAISEYKSIEVNVKEKEVEPLDVKIKDIQVSNKDVVLTDDNRYEDVKITVSLEGEDVASIPENGRFYIYIQKKDAKDTDSVYSLNTTYNAQKKQIEGTLRVSGHLLSTDYVVTTVYISDADGSLTNLINSYTGDKTAFRVTKKTTDQEAPVINAVQVFVNNTLQKTGTITLKKGDVITVRADVDDKNKVSGIFYFMSEDYTSFYGQMNPSAYDLEGKLTCNGTTVPEGTFSLYFVAASDWYGNQKICYEDELVNLFKEVKPNPQNAVLLKNQDTVKGLDNIKANLAELIEMEGAVDETAKTAIKAALEAGKEVTPEISVSSVPATSIESDVRANVQAKADAVFGANTKVAYLDISLNLLVDGSSYGLNQLKEPISITVTLPEELKGDYNYKVIRSHEKADGTTETEVLDAVKNADGTITFKTDRFSTYAIAYSTNEAKGTNGTTGTKAPGTNDMNVAIIYFTLAATVVACATFEKKRRA